jgi:F0F1-type ATP synthase assembly protein I
MIPLAFFAMIFGIFYVSITAKHRQRMAMIEKGLTTADLEKGRPSSPALAAGLLGLGIGLGLALGWLVDKIVNGAEWGANPLPYFISVLMCAGAALVHYHRTMENKKPA